MTFKRFERQEEETNVPRKPKKPVNKNYEEIDLWAHANAARFLLQRLDELVESLNTDFDAVVDDIVDLLDLYERAFGSVPWKKHIKLYYEDRRGSMYQIVHRDDEED